MKSFFLFLLLLTFSYETQARFFGISYSADGKKWTDSGNIKSKVSINIAESGWRCSGEVEDKYLKSAKWNFTVLNVRCSYQEGFFTSEVVCSREQGLMHSKQMINEKRFVVGSGKKPYQVLLLCSMYADGELEDKLNDLTK